jgi:GTP-binding protein LepA C-terminus
MDPLFSFAPEEVIPRQLFEVPIQAVVNNKVAARETISAARKDVTAPLYGGKETSKHLLPISVIDLTAKATSRARRSCWSSRNEGKKISSAWARSISLRKLSSHCSASNE